MPRINTYCDQIGIYEKNAVWYLTSASEREEYELAECLSIYNYSKEELRAILRHGFPELERYFTVFTFDAVNTKLPESDIAFRSDLTFYFEQYKMQKLTNRIFFRGTFDGLKRFFTQKWCFCVKIYRIYKTYLYICPQQVVRKCHICT